MTRPDRRLARMSAPALEPISVADAKLYLRVDGDAEDALIAQMIEAVRLVAEEATGRSLMTQRWKLIYADALPCEVPLPFGPVQAIESVTVVDALGAENVVDAGGYRLHPAADRLVLDAAVSGQQIQVVYVAGFGDAAGDVPAAIRQAMLVHLMVLYGRRDVVEVPELAMDVYAGYRQVRF